MRCPKCRTENSDDAAQIATGDPHEMLAHSKDPRVQEFLTRGAKKNGAASGNG